MDSAIERDMRMAMVESVDRRPCSMEMTGWRPMGCSSAPTLPTMKTAGIDETTLVASQQGQGG